MASMEAPSIETESRIVEATLYSERARLTREAPLTAPGGHVRALVHGLPASLDLATVRVSTNHGVVRYVERAEPNAGEEEMSSSEDSFADLLSEIHRLKGETEALRTEIVLIDRVIPGRGRDAQSPGPLLPDRFLAGLEAVVARRRSAIESLRITERALTEARRALEAAREGRAPSGRDGPPDTLASSPTLRSGYGPSLAFGSLRASLAAIAVGIDAGEGPSEVRLEIRYSAGWATWRPSYNLRLDPVARSVEVERFADVWQETGEAWHEVALRLSTASPDDSLRCPRTLPWHLERVDAYATRARPPAEDSSRSTEPAARIEPDLEISELHEDDGAEELEILPGIQELPRPPPPPAPDPEEARAPRRVEHPDRDRLAEPTPSAALGGLDYEFAVGGKATCRSGVDRHRVHFGTSAHPVRLEYLLRPAQKDHAFLRAEVQNASDAPLLAGPAAIFVGDSYVGRTRIKTTPGGGRLLLDLGAEPGIKSVRKAEARLRSEGLLTREDVHTVAIAVDIVSSLAHEADLEIQDQIPVSSDPRIKVRLLETHPSGAIVEERTGILTFRSRISAGGRSRVVFEYEVHAPEGYRLVQGLEGG